MDDQSETNRLDRVVRLVPCAEQSANANVDRVVAYLEELAVLARKERLTAIAVVTYAENATLTYRTCGADHAWTQLVAGATWLANDLITNSG